jgi:hypothetical protein
MNKAEAVKAIEDFKQFIDENFDDEEKNLLLAINFMLKESDKLEELKAINFSNKEMLRFEESKNIVSNKMIELMADNISEYNPYYKQFNASAYFVIQEFENKAKE